MKLRLAIVLLLFSQLANAQFKIHGKVLDEETKKPLEGISIFLSHTTNGTITNSKGEFQLDRLKSGKYELVATSLNYEDNIVSIQVGSGNDEVQISLHPTANLLKEVVVESYDENGWDKWGDSFKSYFIGTEQLAKNCVFKNPEVVKFKFGSNSNKLRAFANEKLVFENSELGYRIIYLLSKFEIDFNNNTFSFKGYPLFEELKPKSNKELANWNKKRIDIYKGSLRHFIRSLYFGQLGKDGFEVRKIKIVSDDEIVRVKEIVKQQHENEGKIGAKGIKYDQDSLDYYNKVKNLAVDENKVTLNKLIPSEQLVSNLNDANSKALYFNEYLQVLYINKKIPNEFAKTVQAYRGNEFTWTEISLRNNNPVFIYPNGNYYNGLDLLTDGYWAWSEKVSTMLPSDFTPVKNQ